MFSLNEILLKFKRQIFKTSLNSKFVRGSVIGRTLKEPRPPLEDSRVAAAGWLLGTFSIAISTGDSSFQMATTTAFVLQMDHLGPFAGVEARNTRFGDLSSRLHTHNSCQNRVHFTGNEKMLFQTSRRRIEYLFLNPPQSHWHLNPLIVQFGGNMFYSHKSPHEFPSSTLL